MINFSANKQYHVRSQKRTTQDKNGGIKYYWIIHFRDSESKRIVTYSIWDKTEEPTDDEGSPFVSDIPYVISGYVNTVSTSNYLIIKKIKIDKKTLKKLPSLNNTVEKEKTNLI